MGKRGGGVIFAVSSPLEIIQLPGSLVRTPVFRFGDFYQATSLLLWGGNDEKYSSRSF